MKIGTKSVLFGAHCFLIHPIFVFVAWTKLYGFPFDPRLWIAFFIHDLGYWGKPNMDGPEGEEHVLFGAKVMHFLFDKEESKKWYNFSLYHSRFYARRDKTSPSKLCYADKLAVTLEPCWLYLLRTNASKEVYEYMKLAESKYDFMKLPRDNQEKWFYAMTEYLRLYVMEHKDGKIDDWTGEVKTAIDSNGVYK